MAVKNRNQTFGLFKNGDGRYGDNTNFTNFTFNSADQFNGAGCFTWNGGYGGGTFSTEYVEIDSNKEYQYVIYYRTIDTGSAGKLGGGHIGFACYDKNFYFCDRRTQGGIENTVLSRELSVGDSYVYVENSSSWTVESRTVFNHVLIYPPDHPDYSTPWEYTRIGFGEYTLYFSGSEDIGGGERRLQLVNSSNTPITFPDIGYSTPIGTPISRGRAGGTYNYCFSNPNYPLQWTRAEVTLTGNHGSTYTKFRYGTKYIRFMSLLNHNVRNDSIIDQTIAFDNIFLAEKVNGKSYNI